MPNIVLKGFIVVPDTDLDVVKNALPEHIELTRQEPGCLVFEVTPHPTDPNRFDVYEVFNSTAAFNAHQQRVQQSHWGQVTGRVERQYEVTEQS
ncbi:antibiotic biosynthesis monooxygenase [Saccharospirillum sp. MSK14-1]|uniref:putative quinol monooxygenase n=1 Tax=Saccharospirillum sp. MSK14-1 TaxID=1897632 RepID=UPI000D387B68|nr:antibiotic biosynthesis monooxygenase [Saccharospirillum sp. MSK14-1]PTY35800.1 antibiotic biosynthesis monooxygenase [Saccharospirillum sp. MSK14-1]